MLHIGWGNLKNKAFRLYEKKRPTLSGRSFLFMESGNVLLSQVFNHVLSPPQAAHMVEPNQVHSLTWLNTI